MEKEQLKSMEKFDTHSHIGTDIEHPLPSNIDGYLEKARDKKIKRAILIGVPNPANTNKGENPFAEANAFFERQVDLKSTPYLKLHFAPHVHPLYDTPKHLERTLERKPIAVKIHGTSWGINPKDIPKSFFKTIREYDVPLIIHTDYNRRPTNALQLCQRMNDPLVWIDLCERNGVRASLTHGLRLCEESWKRISQAGEQFIVGLAPKLNPNTSLRTKRDSGDYMSQLLEMANLSQLVFDIDFPYNTVNYENPHWTLDEELAGKVSENQLRQIYKETAEKFYRIK